MSKQVKFSVKRVRAFKIVAYKLSIYGARSIKIINSLVEISMNVFVYFREKKIAEKNFEIIYYIKLYFVITNCKML